MLHHSATFIWHKTQHSMPSYPQQWVMVGNQVMQYVLYNRCWFLWTLDSRLQATGFCVGKAALKYLT
jgi:hypothetical protein